MTEDEPHILARLVDLADRSVESLAVVADDIDRIEIRPDSRASVHPEVRVRAHAFLPSVRVGRPLPAATYTKPRPDASAPDRQLAARGSRPMSSVRRVCGGAAGP